MMEVVVTTGAVRRAKLESNRHHQQSNTQLTAKITSQHTKYMGIMSSIRFIVL